VFRYRSGSCAHQYELFPLTIDRAAPDNVPPDHAILLRDRRRQLLFFSVLVAPKRTDATAEQIEAMDKAALSLDGQGYGTDGVATVVSAPLSVVTADGADERVMEPSIDCVKQLVGELEAACGSESDTPSSGGTTSDDTTDSDTS